MPSIFLFSMKALCFNVSQCKGQIIYVLGFYSSILISLPHQNSWSWSANLLSRYKNRCLFAQTGFLKAKHYHFAWEMIIFLVFHLSLVLLSTLKVHRFCFIIYCHKLSIIAFTQFIVSSSMSSLITVSLNIGMKYCINIWGRLPLHEHRTNWHEYRC